MERQFGPYRLVRQVAVGGMAEIHLAKAKGIAGFEKYVALKMIHPNFAEDEQFIDMLVDEAKIAVQLTHHNIAQTFDLGRVGDTYYISMEYVDGADLYKVLRRASEQDIDFPLDVCAFIAKEVASGLDYAHRKRDVTGQQLGIVHRDVSPQNVLLSYAGEVKLVDFGIAKATMKVKQTAAGVIKGKYYYMSPEQASGGNVDSRSDIFSAGIVLYEMLTGQMLYLEEDLHRLLDMVRRADIASPSKLRRGIPPQLERIVMHALARAPQDRYQSGADMASDLERFLHAYSPVFTPAKMVALLRRSVGDPTLNMESPQEQISVLDENQLMREPGEMRDSNSVIFRVKPRPLHDFPPIDTNAATDSGVIEPITGSAGASDGDVRTSAPRVPAAPRLGDSTAKGVAAPPRRPESKDLRDSKRPSREQAKVRPPTAPLEMMAQLDAPTTEPTDGAAPDAPGEPPRRTAPRVSRQHAAAAAARDFHEDTRELPQGFDEDALTADAAPAKPLPSVVRPPPAAAPGQSRPPASAARVPRAATASAPTITADPVAAKAAVAMAPTVAAPPVVTAITALPIFGMEDIEGGDSTLVSSMPSFQADAGFDGEVENTMVQARVPVPEHTDYGETQIRSQPRPENDGAVAEEDGPTTPGRRAMTRQPRPIGAPAALAAKNPTPSVSELRKPRPSRSTPASGSPSLLQAIVAAPGSEPMPVAPRPPTAPPRRATPPPTPVSRPPTAEVGSESLTGHESTQPAQATYVPIASPTQATSFSLPPAPVPPPSSSPPFLAPSQSGPMSYPVDPSGPHELPPAYAHLSAQFPMPGGSNAFANGSYPQAAAPVQLWGGHSSGAFPQGSAGTMTGRLRALEIDEVPAQYRIRREGPRWFVLAALALAAVAAAATVTFLVVRANRQAVIASASLRIESMPSNAIVFIDDKQLPEPTPVVYKQVAPGQRYKVRIELPKYVSYVEEVVVSNNGGELVMRPLLALVTGKLNITSVPAGADIFINGQKAGRTPRQVPEMDLNNVKSFELRLPKYDPHVQAVEWGDKTELSFDIVLTPAGQKPR